MINILPFINSFGISVHISALNCEDDFGIGDLSDAYRFVDFLNACNINVWKVLPINTITKIGNYSPYEPESVFALDFIYCNIYKLDDVDNHIKEYIELNRPSYQKQRVSYKQVKRFKGNVLQLAFNNFYSNEYLTKSVRFKAFDEFVNEEKLWLTDYALYKILRRELKGKPLKEWPKPIQQRNEDILNNLLIRYEKEILYEEYIQWVMQIQWLDLHEYANSKNVKLIGDIPMYTSLESSDIWRWRENFDVNESFEPNSFGGAPPDYFSKEGQLWNVPTYNWEYQKQDNYSWWINRLIRQTRFFDGLRLDHFRGFIDYWRIGKDQLAKHGEWEKGPGDDFLFRIAKEIIDKRLCTIWVEDLGTITEEVENTRKEIGVSGYMVFVYYMKQILEKNIVYDTNAQTTTHDSLTLIGYWKQLSLQERQFILDRLEICEKATDAVQLGDEIRWKIIENLLADPFQIVVIPIQDILGIEDQMNDPGKVHGNWQYRMNITVDNLIKDISLIKKLNELAKKYSRGKFYKDYFATTVPCMRKPVKRYYYVGEEMHFWILSEESSNVEAITNLPIKENLSLDNKTIPFEFVKKTEQGFIMHCSIKAIQAGKFYLTAKIDETYIASFENDLTIEVG